MARIAGVDLPNNKRVEIGLTYIYGIGLTTSKKIIKETGINPDTRVKDLSENDVAKLEKYSTKIYFIHSYDIALLNSADKWNIPQLD